LKRVGGLEMDQLKWISVQTMELVRSAIATFCVNWVANQQVFYLSFRGIFLSGQLACFRFWFQRKAVELFRIASWGAQFPFESFDIVSCHSKADWDRIIGISPIVIFLFLNITEGVSVDPHAFCDTPTVRNYQASTRNRIASGFFVVYRHTMGNADGTVADILTWKPRKICLLTGCTALVHSRGMK
jgi:hypothetical protein